MFWTSSISNLKRFAIPNSSSEVRGTNLKRNNEFLKNWGFINSSSSPKETRRRTRNDEENVGKNEKAMNVRKSSRLVAESEEKKEKKRKVKEETISQSVLIVSINIKMEEPMIHFEIYFVIRTQRIVQEINLKRQRVNSLLQKSQ